MNRRDFLKNATASAAMLTSFPACLSEIEREKTPGLIEKRSLGRTGEKLSIIGLGGVVLRDTTTEDAAKYVKLAIERGVNYFDVAPSYGNAEEMMGPALEPYRKDVFLACKTTERSAQGSRKELEASLKRLRTDHFDLYQLHSMTKMADVETVFAPGGAMETFLKAREEGKTRFIGFSAHSVEAAMALMDRFDFDTILFPFNYATWHAGSFGPQVMAKAHGKGMGVLALKAMAKTQWQNDADRKAFPKCWYEPLDDPKDALMGLRFTLSHPVTAAVPPGDEGLFKLALDLAPQFTPLSASEVDEVKRKGLEGIPLFSYPSAEA